MHHYPLFHISCCIWQLLSCYTYQLPARRFIQFDLFNNVDLSRAAASTVFDQTFQVLIVRSFALLSRFVNAVTHQ